MKLIDYLNKDLNDTSTATAKEDKADKKEKLSSRTTKRQNKDVNYAQPEGGAVIAAAKTVKPQEENPQNKRSLSIGLSSKEAAIRLLRDGENILKAKAKIHPVGLFLAQYKDIMTMILLVCTAISVFMGEFLEAITIAIIVLMNGILGFIQEFKTEKTLNALREMAAPNAKVYRDGTLQSVAARELVQGDRIKLTAGDKIPADCAMLSCTMLECDESMLSGESIPVKKSESDRAYMGCTVTAGHGEAEVTATGMKTEMGSIARMLSDIEEEATPLQKKLAQLSKYIAAGCLIVCAVVSLTGILRGENLFDMLITGVSLAVAAVPEGLPAIVTIALALSVSRMVKRNALVRKLHAVETLGCATIICSDKTGTITQNEMTATAVCSYDKSYKAAALDPNDEVIKKALCTAVLCNNADIDGATPDGSHTERSLLKLCAGYNITKAKLSAGFRRIDERPFDSKRKQMTVLCEDTNGKRFLFAKGAYDILLKKCTYIMTNQGVVPITPAHKKGIMEKGDYLANSALRIIGLCYKPCESKTIETEEGMIFLAIVGMIDPPRPEVKPAVMKCKMAGIRPVMITGDHKNTAVAIAKKVNIFTQGDTVLTGAEIDSLTDKELCEKCKTTTVFARVSPEHKLRIVKTFKRNGEVVAMTGDGVNDAPAVKEADIGVSMGESGTDVTKEAAQIILLDDNFATLVNAVDEGRSIYGNIRKFIRYLLSCNIGEVLTMFIGMLFGMPPVLIPIQILLVNLVTDGLPAIALSVEPPDPHAMGRPPRKANESVFSGGLSFKIIVRGMMIGAATLLSFCTVFGMTKDLSKARSAALFALVFTQLIHVFECKSEEKTLFEINLLDNKKLIAAVLLSMGILLLTIYFGPMQAIFSTAALSIWQIFIVLLYCFFAPVCAYFIHKMERKRK